MNSIIYKIWKFRGFLKESYCEYLIVWHFCERWYIFIELFFFFFLLKFRKIQKSCSTTTPFLFIINIKFLNALIKQKYYNNKLKVIFCKCLLINNLFPILLKYWVYKIYRIHLYIYTKILVCTSKNLLKNNILFIKKFKFSKFS